MEDRVRINIVLIRVRILLRFNGIPPFLSNSFDRSAETFLPRMDRDFERVLFWCEGADIFFIVLAERVMGPVEIDQRLSPGDRFDIEISSLRISLFS